MCSLRKRNNDSGCRNISIPISRIFWSGLTFHRSFIINSNSESLTFLIRKVNIRLILTILKYINIVYSINRCTFILKISKVTIEPLPIIITLHCDSFIIKLRSMSQHHCSRNIIISEIFISRNLFTTGQKCHFYRLKP